MDTGVRPAPTFRRVLSRWDLVLYGLAFLSPTAPFSYMIALARSTYTYARKSLNDMGLANTSRVAGFLWLAHRAQGVRVSNRGLI